MWNVRGNQHEHITPSGAADNTLVGAAVTPA